MSEYVEGFTADQIKEIAAKAAHIPTSEVEKDIADTEAEIFQMERELPGHKILAEAGDRLADMRYRANRDGIEERKRFVVKLKLILEHRKANAPQA